MEDTKLTEFETKLLDLLSPIQKETWFENFIFDLRQIMPPTCTPNERKFLDEIKGNFYFDGYGLAHEFGESLIEQDDFEESNLSELVEKKE